MKSVRPREPSDSWRCPFTKLTSHGCRDAPVRGKKDKKMGCVQTGRQRWDRSCLGAWFRAEINQWECRDQGKWPIQGAWFSKRMKEGAILSPKAIIHAHLLVRRSVHSEIWPMFLVCTTLKYCDSSYKGSILIVGWLKHRLEQYQGSFCWPPAGLKCSTFILKSLHEC